MFEKLSQEQFEQILNMLILYKQAHRDTDVYLNEKCIKKALFFMNNARKDMHDTMPEIVN